MPDVGALQDPLEPAPRLPRPVSSPVEADQTFRRLLGDAAWRRLDPNVRVRFAIKPAAGDVFTFVGEMAVVQCSWYGWLLAHLCRLIGTPLAPQRGRDVPTVVRIFRSPRGDGVTWERRYAFRGRRPVVIASTKRPNPPDGLLECAARGFAMRLRLFERDGALHFASTGYCVEVGPWRIPIPHLLTPGVAHVVHSDEGGGWFRFTMRFRHRLFGVTYYQEGLFHQTLAAP